MGKGETSELTDMRRGPGEDGPGRGHNTQRQQTIDYRNRNKLIFAGA